MRILWLKSDLLLPLDKGGKLRTWHLMRHLAQRHAITYLAFKNPGQPAADVDGILLQGNTPDLNPNDIVLIRVKIRSATQHVAADIVCANCRRR